MKNTLEYTKRRVSITNKNEIKKYSKPISIDSYG